MMGSFGGEGGRLMDLFLVGTRKKRRSAEAKKNRAMVGSIAKDINFSPKARLSIHGTGARTHVSTSLYRIS